MSENHTPSFEGTPFANGDQIGLHAASDNLVSYEELLARREMEVALQAASRESQSEQLLTPEQRIGKIGTNLAAVRSDYLGMKRTDFELMTAHVSPSDTQRDFGLTA